MKNIKVPVEVSARHCHLCQKDLDVLFGKNYELTKIKQLSQPSDFACQETVNIKVNSHILENVRIIGPVRSQTQVEISKTDAIFLEANSPIRLSGDLENSEKVILISSKSELELKKGLIIAKNHIHCSTKEAERFGFENGDFASVKIGGERPVIFENVSVRVNDNYKLCFHIDTDEGNAANINKIGEGEIL
jgi:putative phosphotransacetylase